jgi:hypothetical protein
MYKKVTEKLKMAEEAKIARILQPNTENEKDGREYFSKPL